MMVQANLMTQIHKRKILIIICLFALFFSFVVVQDMSNAFFRFAWLTPGPSPTQPEEYG